MRIRELFESRFGPTPLDRFKPRLVIRAQHVYDKWDESDIDTYAHGGICHWIADEFAQFFYEQGFTAFTESSNFEQHVFTVVIVKKPPEQMEEDEPFSWCKLPDVEFDQHDISIEYIGSGDEIYKNFEIEKD